MEELEVSVYCPVCESCGEEECCSPLICQHVEGGSYCKTNLRHLKLGYLLAEYLQNNLYSKLPEELKKEYDDKWHEFYDEIFI